MCDGRTLVGIGIAGLVLVLILVIIAVPTAIVIKSQQESAAATNPAHMEGHPTAKGVVRGPPATMGSSILPSTSTAWTTTVGSSGEVSVYYD